jgi:hypothetical protein
MGLMDATAWAQMQADLQAIRDDNAVSIQIKRAGVVLAAQTVRIARMAAQGTQVDAGSIQQATGRAVVLGAPTLDIRTGDRFVDSGNLYEVVLVRPNRRAATVAEARLVQ